MAGHWKGVGVEKQKERENFHYVNEKKGENRSINVFLK